MIQSAIQRVESGHDLSMDEVVETFDADHRRTLRRGRYRPLAAGPESQRPERERSGRGGHGPAAENDADPLLAARTAGYLRHRRRPVAHLQYQHGRGPGHGRGGRAGGQAWQSRGQQPQRIGRRAGRAGRERRGRRRLRRALPGRVGHLLLLCSAVAQRHEARRPRAEETGRADHLQHPRSADQSGRGIATVARGGPGGTAAAAGRGPGPAGHRAERGRPRQRRPRRGHAHAAPPKLRRPPARCGISAGPRPTSDWEASS